MFILGINAYHADSAACLLRDGELVAAAEEERFRRIKHWAGLPTQAIRYCLEEGKIRASEIDHVAVNRDPRVHPWRRLLFLLRHRPDVRLVGSRIRNLFAAHSLPRSLESALCAKNFGGKIHYVEHHCAHLASAYLSSGLDQAACVSIDGCGDFVSTVWGFGNGDIRIDGRIYFPHSLGIFYSAITQLLGFRSFGDEYKVMGLAAYGRPKHLHQLRKVLRLQANGLFKLELTYFRHHIEDVSYRWEDCAPEVGTLYTPALEALLGPARRGDEVLEQQHKDLARSAQDIYEEALFSLLNYVYDEFRCQNLALAGGCALNSVANGKIYYRTPFRKLFVPPAAGDAGGAIGAALVVWQQIRRAQAEGRSSTLPATLNPRHSPGIPDDQHAYTGPEFEDATVGRLLHRRGLFVAKKPGPVLISTRSSFEPDLAIADPASPNPMHSMLRSAPSAGADFSTKEFLVTYYCNSDELCRRAARAIAEGNIVGCFQGRMEWGPRALGNRSILCDPRRGDIREILNTKIKRRESFRPFAPSILRAHVGEWFEQEDDVPFMSAVFQVREEKRALIPAVTHVDGSGRLQTVYERMNPFFYALISEFHALTSVPMVLNTSFNEQEPIVCHPEEALDCFLRTKMDALMLGRFFIRRRSEA
jgi:carbamoyltransferase